MVLGDHFPEEDKIKKFHSQLKPGMVFYLSCDFTTPPKDKFLLLVCVEPKPLFFVINSKIHEYIKLRPALMSSQVCLAVGEHDFLEHDSYVNCADAIDAFHIKDIEKQVLKRVDRMKSSISQGARNQVISAVKGAQTINKLYKSWILKCLE